jgi:hypothetical protein
VKLVQLCPTAVVVPLEAPRRNANSTSLLNTRNTSDVTAAMPMTVIRCDRTATRFFPNAISPTPPRGYDESAQLAKPFPEPYRFASS